MIRIHDCSNSVFRPNHRGGGGPIQNDIVRYLKENAQANGFSFVSEMGKADIAFTNDVFPDNIKKSSIPKVKRMDGVFSQIDLCERNTNLTESAAIANHVIFISEFSRRSLLELYGLDKSKSSVVLNQVDPSIFFPANTPVKSKCRNVVAIASNWARKEKRFADTMALAQLAPHWTFSLIGTCNCSPGSIPENVNLQTILLT